MGSKKKKKRADRADAVPTRASTMDSSRQRGWTTDPRKLLAVHGELDLATIYRDKTPGWDEGKKDGQKAMEDQATDLAELQERLFAQAHSDNGSSEAVLIVLQGLDTAGKGGIVRHVMGLVDPQGVSLAAFKAPTKEELKHHFLWRIRRELPEPGMIGVFDRSHYEDVLVPTAQKLVDHDDEHGRSWVVDDKTLRDRYRAIRRFEKRTLEKGIHIIKIFLAISFEEQGERLRERLDRRDKHWKFSTGDLVVRNEWSQYQQAYQEVISRTSTDDAPWYVVPADRKWYARLAVSEILRRTLIDINPSWPQADFDVDQALVDWEKTTSPEALARFAFERSDSHEEFLDALAVMDEDDDEGNSDDSQSAHSGDNADQIRLSTDAFRYN